MRVRALLVMRHAHARAVRDCGGVAMFVVISSILGADGRSCLTVRDRRAQARPAGVAPDTLTGVSRPEVP